MYESLKDGTVVINIFINLPNLLVVSVTNYHGVLYFSFTIVFRLINAHRHVKIKISFTVMKLWVD